MAIAFVDLGNNARFIHFRTGWGNIFVDVPQNPKRDSISRNRNRDSPKGDRDRAYARKRVGRQLGAGSMRAGMPYNSRPVRSTVLFIARRLLRPYDLGGAASSARA
jgi:hypothetical protein